MIPAFGKDHKLRHRLRLGLKCYESLLTLGLIAGLF